MWKELLIRKGYCSIPIMDSNAVQYYSNKILHECDLTHSEYVWQLREICYPYFQELWNTDNLLTSFQTSINFHEMFRCDQPPEYNKLCCIQGLITLNESGIRLIQESRDIFKSYTSKYKIDKPFIINENDPLIIKSNIIEIIGKPGTLILWDSRMFYSGIKDSLNITISMQPKISDDNTIQQRINAFQHNQGTGVWTSGKWFYVKNNISNINNVKLNSLRKQLIGY